jgi:hypothetical protein
MLCDFHFHTEFSADSETPVRAQIERAIRKIKNLFLILICIFLIWKRSAVNMMGGSV